MRIPVCVGGRVGYCSTSYHTQPLPTGWPWLPSLALTGRGGRNGRSKRVSERERERDRECEWLEGRKEGRLLHGHYDACSRPPTPKSKAAATAIWCEPCQPYLRRPAHVLFCHFVYHFPFIVPCFSCRFWRRWVFHVYCMWTCIAQAKILASVRYSHSSFWSSVFLSLLAEMRVLRAVMILLILGIIWF